jgi:hypothetical protein
LFDESDIDESSDIEDGAESHIYCNSGGEEIIEDETEVKGTNESKFDERCNDLEKFKKKFGHCSVPFTYAENPRLVGRWCSTMRVSYNQQEKGQNPRTKLSEDYIARLEMIGFTWESTVFEIKFEKHCNDLEEFNKKFGHCSISQGYADTSGLAPWCNKMRVSYNSKRDKTHLRSYQRITLVGLRRLASNGKVAEISLLISAIMSWKSSRRSLVIVLFLNDMQRTLL